jgi:hypothetical protein
MYAHRMGKLWLFGRDFEEMFFCADEERTVRHGW